MLSDPDKRRNYNQFGDEDSSSRGFHFNFDDFFKGFNDHFRQHHQRHHEQHGQDFTEHFRQHNHHRQQQQNTFRFESGPSFDFDSLFDDEDEDIFSTFHFGSQGPRGAADANAKVRRGGTFFEFDDFFDDEDFYYDDDPFEDGFFDDHDAFSFHDHLRHHQPNQGQQQHNFQNLHSFGQSHHSGELEGQGGGCAWCAWWWCMCMHFCL